MIIWQIFGCDCGKKKLQSKLKTNGQFPNFH